MKIQFVNFESINAQLLKHKISLIDHKILGDPSKNVYLVLIRLNKDSVKKAILKLHTKEDRFYNELRGAKIANKYFKSPKILFSSQKKTGHFYWLIIEYLKGKTFYETFNESKSPKDFNNFYSYEESKEIAITNTYSKTKETINYENYLKLPSNSFFYKRLFGSRYKEYYVNKNCEIISFIDNKIVLNGKDLFFTPLEIIHSIREKYNSVIKIRNITTYIGHGDAHHGNIIITDNGVYFIDNEHCGQVTPMMDLAKPYYNDLFGKIFFSRSKSLQQLIKVTQVRIVHDQIHIKTKINPLIKILIKLTKIKLLTRSKYLANSNDFLILNDYLILCHILTKNPNTYPPEKMMLFLTFIITLSQFDPYNPESFLKYYR